MLDKDPAKRPSASEVLRNEYIAQNLAVRIYLDTDNTQFTLNRFLVALSILSCCDIFFYSSINNSDHYAYNSGDCYCITDDIYFPKCIFFYQIGKMDAICFKCPLYKCVSSFIKCTYDQVMVQKT